MTVTSAGLPTGLADSAGVLRNRLVLLARDGVQRRGELSGVDVDEAAADAEHTGSIPTSCHEGAALPRLRRRNQRHRQVSVDTESPQASDRCGQEVGRLNRSR